MHTADRSQTCILLLVSMVVSGYSYVLQPKLTVMEAASVGGAADVQSEQRAHHPRNRTAALPREGAASERAMGATDAASAAGDGRAGRPRKRAKLEREERDNLVAGIHLQERRGGRPRGDAALTPRPPKLRAGGPPSLRHSSTLAPPSGVPPPPPRGPPPPPSSASAGGLSPAGAPGATKALPPPRAKQRRQRVGVAPTTGASTGGKKQHGGGGPPAKGQKRTSASTASTAQPTEPGAAAVSMKPTPKSPKSRDQRKTKPRVKPNKALPPEPTAMPVVTRPAANATASRQAGLGNGGKIKRNQNKGSTPKSRPAKGTNGRETTAVPTTTAAEVTTAPYFKDGYCPPECVCYGGVVQCSDKGVDKVPYGVPYNARYILLMNNRIDGLQPALFREHLAMEFLALSNNRLADAAIEGAFAGVRALKRLHLDRNLLESVPADLPASLEELRLDNNGLRATSEAPWLRCPGLLVLSLSNNSLGNGSEGLPDGALSPLRRLRTLSLDGNGLARVPLGLPPSVRELYLRGNRIRRFRGGVFAGPSQLTVLDLSGNLLADEGLARASLLNAARLESLNLGGNALSRVPRHLPGSLKTLNLEGNLIASVGRGAFRSLPNLEHLGMARNEIFRVAPGAFGALAALHQLDLCHNALREVPRRLPLGLHTAALTHNRIRTVPRDAFCWEGEAQSRGHSGLVRVELEHNLIDLGSVDAEAFRCLRGSQVVQFY